MLLMCVGAAPAATPLQSWIMCTMQSSYNVADKWSKMYTLSWTSVVMVLLLGYTAELTSVLILASQPPSMITRQVSCCECAYATARSVECSFQDHAASHWCGKSVAAC